MIRIALLGATGSIGRSTLAVVRRHADRFRVVGVSAHRSTEALAALVDEFRPDTAVVADDGAFAACGGPGRRGDTEWRGGARAVAELAAGDDVDVVVNALVGAAGLDATLAALETGHRLALANKESLVAGGPLVRRALARGGGALVPVDSEHSAILQCIEGAPEGSVARVVLTASGGPFRGWTPDELARVGPEAALRHPTWDMGAKITIDSATLANKSLEVIEAHVLYGLDYDRIDAVVHPQSIVHSFVEFVDGSVLAQVGDPTMELPILYALTYPDRVADAALRGFDPVACSPLTFEEIDHAAFPLFGLGVGAGRRGGMAPAAFNAGNEIAVAAFLEGRVSFPGMARVVEAALEAVGSAEPTSVDEVREADREARRAARAQVERLKERTA
ncbi:MAG: 1-deoxy-D-xylulose-5-phosphate reductoisomerase [Longimicrobiales bacterium]